MSWLNCGIAARCQRAKLEDKIISRRASKLHLLLYHAGGLTSAEILGCAFRNLSDKVVDTQNGELCN